jgi:hypothetical protein
MGYVKLIFVLDYCIIRRNEAMKGIFTEMSIYQTVRQSMRTFVILRPIIPVNNYGK